MRTTFGSTSARLVVAMMAGLALGGCTYSVHEVNVSDFTPGVSLHGAAVVSAKSEQFVILGFTGNTDYVDAAREQLMTECASGRVEGITTQYSTDLGFMSWTNRILMKGYCVPEAT